MEEYEVFVFFKCEILLTFVLQRLGE